MFWTSRKIQGASPARRVLREAVDMRVPEPFSVTGQACSHVVLLLGYQAHTVTRYAMGPLRSDRCALTPACIYHLHNTGTERSPPAGSQ